MIDSSDVRKININRIRTLMWRGGKFTKLSVAKATGFSVATSNTLLNELANTGEIIGEKRHLNGVGRGSIVYRINEQFESILCLRIDISSDEIRYLHCDILSMLGKQLFKETKQYNKLDEQTVIHTILELIEQYTNINCIIIGICGIIDEGVVFMSDIPELEGIPLEKKIASVTNVPLYIAYDCQFRVYGEYKRSGYSTETLSLVYAVKNVLPGTASVVENIILNGRNGFAGMTGYMSFDIDREELIKKVTTNDAAKYVADSVIALITILNPNEIVYAGNVFDAKVLEEIRQISMKKLPEKIIPSFRILENPETCYLDGMYYKAIEIKTEFPKRFQ